MLSFDDLRARYMAFSKRERVLIGIAAAMLAIVVLWLALRGGGETATEERVELTEAVQAAPASVPSAPPAAVATPTPSPLYPAPPTPAEAAPIGALQLRGVLSGAAIISVADGPQRTVRVGREAAPGMVLKEVGVRHAVFGAPGGDQRLDLLPSAAGTAGTAPAQ